jgi:Xaa-Pro aminopeptidase
MTERLSRLMAKARKEGLDAFLVYSDVNRNYLSGFTGTSGAILLRGHRADFITDSRYTLQARRQVKGAKVQLQTRALLPELAERLKKAGARRVGLEAGQVTLAQAEWLKKALPKVEWVPTQGWVEELRKIKDADEREAMRQAARITDQAFAALLPHIKAGVSEERLAALLEHEMRLRGAEGPSFETIVASGWRSALPHGVASPKKIAAGELIVFDFGCRWRGYCSDMSRTVCVGKPSALQAKIYGLVKRAQAAGLRAVRAGRPAGAVDKASRDVIAAAGYASKFGHGTGHGVGREVHEDPRVGPKASERLRPGMAITVEPGIYLPGKFGVRIEDLVFVTSKGHENLYSTTKELLVVG